MLLLILLLDPVRLVFRGSIEDIPLALAAGADFENAGQVAAAVTVVGSTPDGGQSVVKHDHVSFVAKLVRPKNVRHGVDVEELFHDLRAKSVASSPWAEREFVPIAVRITPDQVRHGALVWDLPETVDNLDLVNAVNAGAESSVDAEDLVVDNTGQRKVVEHVGEMVPDGSVAVFPAALGVEAVGLGDAAGLMVAADQVDSIGPSQLQADEERNRLDTEKTAVDVVAFERGGRVSLGSMSQRWSRARYIPRKR